MWDECPPSYFHMWMSSCVYTIFWKDCSFPIFTFVFEKYFQIISKQFFFSFFPYLKDFASLSSGLILTFVPLYVLFSLMDLHNFIKIYPGAVFVMFLVLEVHWDSWMCGPKVFIKFGNLCLSFLSKIFLPLLPLESPITCILVHLKLFLNSMMLCSIFSIFFSLLCLFV